MVIPLPGTDMWEALTIRQKMQVLLNRVPDSAPDSAAIHAIERRILEQFPDENKTRYQDEPEKRFWEAVYRLPWSAQILIMQSYDAFNADAAQTIKMERPDAEALWHYRENIVNEFYGGLGMKAEDGGPRRAPQQQPARRRGVHDADGAQVRSGHQDPAGRGDAPRGPESGVAQAIQQPPPPPPPELPPPPPPLEPPELLELGLDTPDAIEVAATAHAPLAPAPPEAPPPNPLQPPELALESACKLHRRNHENEQNRRQELEGPRIEAGELPAVIDRTAEPGEVDQDDNGAFLERPAKVQGEDHHGVAKRE